MKGGYGLWSTLYICQVQAFRREPALVWRCLEFGWGLPCLVAHSIPANPSLIISTAISYLNSWRPIHPVNPSQKRAEFRSMSDPKQVTSSHSLPSTPFIIRHPHRYQAAILIERWVKNANCLSPFHTSRLNRCSPPNQAKRRPGHILVIFSSCFTSVILVIQVRNEKGKDTHTWATPTHFSSNVSKLCKEKRPENPERRKLFLNPQETE